MMRANKTIAHVVQHLQSGGIENLALEMLRVEDPRSRQVIVSLEGSASEAISAWPRLAGFEDRIHFMEKKPGLDRSLPIRIARLLKAEGVDVVQTHHVGPLIYGGPAARLAGARLLHVEHDAWHLEDPRRRNLVRGFASVLRPKFVAVSALVAEKASATIGQTFSVIPNGVDMEKFKPGSRSQAQVELGLDDVGDRRLIVCAARLEAVKGVDVLIDALATMPEETVLAVAGDGSARASLERQAVAIAPERVHFLGNIDNTPELFRAADVCALPSRAEGLPLSLLESQSAGCPVVATDVGGMPSAVDPGTGVVVTAENPAALARGLSTVLARPSSTASREFIASGYSLSAMMGAYEQAWAA